jgi:hypothetical protein
MMTLHQNTIQDLLAGRLVFMPCTTKTREIENEYSGDR